MRALIAIALFALLSGCMNQRPDSARTLTRAEAAVIGEAEVLWNQAGLEEIGEECRSDRAGLRIKIPPSDEAWERHTGLCPPFRGDACRIYAENHDCMGCAWATVYYHRVGIWPFALNEDDTHPTVYVYHEGSPPMALAHEYLHILERCTGRDWARAPGYGGADRRHGDPDGPGEDTEPPFQGPIWGDEGIYKELQRRAREIVKEASGG